MLRMLYVAAAAALFIAFWPDTDARADLRYEAHQTEEGVRFIVVHGTFEPDDDLSQFAAAVSRNDPQAIVFDSPGGNPAKAMLLGRMIRALQLDTVQIREAECASACALAFMGGVERHAAAGSIGVHKSSFNGSIPLDTDLAVSLVQEMTAEIIAYMSEMGVDPALLQLALKYESNDIRYLSGSEMEQYRLTKGPSDGPARARQAPPPARGTSTQPPRAASLPPSSAQAYSHPALPVARSGSVRHPAGRAPMKQRPDGKAKDLANLRNGERLSILDDQDRWFQVRAGRFTGYMHHTWVSVDQYFRAPFDDRHIQIKSFSDLRELEAFVRASGLPLSAYLASNGWYAVTVNGTYDKQSAIRLTKTLKADGAIPSDSYVTYGNTYIQKICCN